MNKPPKAYSIKVPTKTYLRKYLTTFYGSPIPLSYHNTLGTFMLSVLEKRYFDINMNDSDSEIRLSYMQDKVEFQVLYHTMKYKGCSVSPDKIIAINRFFEDLFVEDLAAYIKANTKSEGRYKGFSDAIYAFAEICGIEVEEDISFEALKKAESRYRRRIEKKFQRFVPSQNGSTGMSFLGSIDFLAIG